LKIRKNGRESRLKWLAGFAPSLKIEDLQKMADANFGRVFENGRRKKNHARKKNSRRRKKMAGRKIKKFKKNSLCREKNTLKVEN
jgi:hypothetical protein